MGRTGYLSLKFDNEILELILEFTSRPILSINDKYDEQKIKLSERKKERKKNIGVTMILIYDNIYKYVISRKYSLSTSHCTVETTHHI
jgi:hypothetical protein